MSKENNQGITRREFLIRSSVTSAGAVLGIAFGANIGAGASSRCDTGVYSGDLVHRHSRRQNRYPYR